MRWSATFIPTLRQSPTGAVARSHELMLRAGLIRAFTSGSFSYLPLGARVLNKVTALVREEMDRAGALEVLLPVLWPEEVLHESGRLGVFADDVIRFTDRHGRDHVLAPTHEEVVTAIVRDDVQSYRALPLVLYQIQTKYRDEPRPRFGVVRTREFIMKDAYSFSADEAGLDECYRAMRAAYERVMRRCALRWVVAEADPGAMGGGESHEFIVPCDVGTAEFVECPGCGRTANVEVARAALPEPAGPDGPEPELREIETPGQTTIAQVSAFLGCRPGQMTKTLIYVADGRPVAVLVRGDHEVNDTKLARALGAAQLELANATVIEEVTGAPVGFAGPVGLDGVEVLADLAVAAVRDGVTGANRADAHLVGVVPGRDFAPTRQADLRAVTAGDPCATCGAALQLRSGMEVGHVFKLGTKYSEALGAAFVDAEGRRRPYVMGCYGLGVNRLAAAAIECHADDRGIVWPPAIAPYTVEVLALDLGLGEVAGAAERAYASLVQAGLDVILDDRQETPGVKFNDADLVGFPVRIVIGRRFVNTGKRELQVRRDGTKHEVAPDGVAAAAVEALARLDRSMCAG